MTVCMYVCMYMFQVCTNCTNRVVLYLGRDKLAMFTMTVHVNIIVYMYVHCLYCPVIGYSECKQTEPLFCDR